MRKETRIKTPSKHAMTYVRIGNQGGGSQMSQLDQEMDTHAHQRQTLTLG